MLRNTTKKRTRALILFLASTGARIWTVEELKFRNLVEMPDKCKTIQFYEESNEEYWNFLTPEASNALDEYLEERRRMNYLEKCKLYQVNLDVCNDSYM